MNIESGKDGKDGVDGIDGKDGIATDGSAGYVHPDNMVLSSIYVNTLHVHDVQIMDSLETFGTVDMYGSGDSPSQDSDSRRLLAKKRDHCTTCEQKFSDQNTCVNSCSSHIKLEKNGFGEVFHKCCKN
jgi:hypothetical protein